MNKVQSRVKTNGKGIQKAIKSFQVIHFPNPEDPKKTVIIGYALTEEGYAYEFTGGTWHRLAPIID